jgi:hypothetical protein
MTGARAGETRWLLICGKTQVVLAECQAAALRDAQRVLRLEWRQAPNGSFVTSALSWSLGMVKPLPLPMCSSCGQRERAGRDRKCDRCRAAHGREQSMETREKISVALRRSHVTRREQQRSA